MGSSNVEERVLDIKVRYGDAIAGILEYQKKLDELKEAQKRLKEEVKDGTIGELEYRAELAQNKAEMKEAQESIKVLEKETRNNLKTQKENEGSLKSLRAELSNATKAYDEMSRAERESKKGLQKMNEINRITDELKAAEEQTQRFYRNVGNYRDSILQATAANIPFINEIHNMTSSFGPIGKYLSGIKSELSDVILQYKEGSVSANAMSGAQRAAAISSNLLSTALKILKVALIATGIGAIVVLLGSLVAWMTKTQKGTEFLSNVMASFGAIVNVLIDRVAKFGGALVKLFSGDFSGAWNDMKDSAKGLGEEITNDAKQAWALNDAMQQLEKQETMLTK